MMYDMYELDFSSITDREINSINNNYDQFIVQVEDTKHLSSEILSKIDNKAKIHITGPLKGEKYNNQRYFNRNTYKIRELKEIINIMESIEKNIDPKWNEMQRAMYVYNTLASKMVYNFDFMNNHDEKNQSLMALVNRTGVCAGFSSIYYEMMKRQGIKCDYVRGMSGEERHAWNVLTIDDKSYGIDLTWESGKNQMKDDNTFGFFGNYERFEKNHIPDSDEPVHKLTQLSDDVIRDNMDVINGKSKTFKTIVRKDTSAFVISKLCEEDVNNNVIYKYAQSELDMDGNVIKTNVLYSETDFDSLDQEGKSYFYNNLLDRSRINKYSTSTNGYVGSIRLNPMGNYEKIINHGIANEIREKSTNYTREDNTNVIISKTENPVRIKNINSYEATEFINTKSGIALKSSVICTKDNLLENKQSKEKDFISNELLSREHIDKSLNNGGYIGNGTNVFGRYVKLPDKAMEKKVAELKALEQQKMMAA